MKLTKEMRKILGLTKEQAETYNKMYAKAQKEKREEQLVTENLLLMVDSYKVSHWMQFPVGMEQSFYYVSSRGGEYDEIMMAGVHYLTKILERGVTLEDVEEAKEFYGMHFGSEVFHYEGWKAIVEKYNGKLPIHVRAIPEGVIVPVKNALLTIETDDTFLCGWLAGYLETLILRAIWYQTTVATISFESKKAIKRAMSETSTLPTAERIAVQNFRLHDFGARGVSSGESASLGGLAHLYNFMGSDTVEAIWLARKLFGEDMAGFSIPAREHSTTTCYLREGEYDAFMNSVEKFGGGLFAVVIDSYSTKAALEWLTTNQEFLDKLTEKGGTCVLRPDSGNPVDMVALCLETVWKNLEGTVNDKGYKVLDNRFRVIQGDGVDDLAIKRIIEWAIYGKRFSMENLAFGMGGGLLQQSDRDTQRFAMKCSAMQVNGVWRDVYKSPETDPSKRSKAGRLDCVQYANGEIETVVLGSAPYAHGTIMKTVFKNGERMNLQTLSEIRELSHAQS